jgi:aminopeptidase N
MKSLPKALFLVTALIFFGPSSAGAETTAEQRILLPSSILPHRYDLTVRPDPEKLSFEGSVRIAIEVLETTSQITLNAAELEFRAVALDGRGDERPDIAIDAGRQTATFTFRHPIAPGRHRLDIDYRGRIFETPQGLFAVSYDTPEGRRRMLTTHFEAADARRFLPSWDEPARKAAFALTAITPAGQVAVSNMPEMTAEVLPDGSRRTRFQETPRMSSYLLFLGIGDLERRETVVDGTVLGVVTKRGDVEKARFALDSAADLLRFYNAYFGAPYPLPKLDMVAVPGSAGFSAMENWGAILHFEQAMLIDPQLSTEANRQGVFTIVAHEIAHQWFGNLVTMVWWDDLWLNEGFASWMETKATDHFHPEWRVWLKSEAGRQRAMRQDSMRTTHPIVQPVLSAQQATQAFDSITYNKGQAVVRMLEGHVGEDAFREGVRAYMRKFSYANAETAEFWDELEAAAPDRQVREIARDFTEQPGVPLIAVRTGSCVDGRTPLSLRQQRFGVDQDSLRPLTWSTPVSAHAVGSGEGATRLLVRGPESLPVMLGSCAPVKVNAGQTAVLILAA